MPTKWVKAAGGNDSNTGDDRDHAWQHIQTSVRKLKGKGSAADPAVLKVVLEGDYVEHVRMVGSDYSWIHIQGVVGGAITRPSTTQFCEQRPRVGGSALNPIDSPIFSLQSAQNVTLENLTILWGNGGITAKDCEQLSIKACCIHHNHAKHKDGGGFAIVDSQNLLVENCRVWSNICLANDSQGGGGFIEFCGDSRIEGSVFHLNEAHRGGGLLANGCWGARISNCAFGAASDPTGMVGPNEARSGGGIYMVESDDMRIGAVGLPVTIKANIADEAGGGVRLLTGSYWFLNAIIQDNHSKGDGGGLHVYDEGNVDVTLNDTDVSLNQADTDGGGIWVNNSSLLVMGRSVIGSNRAPAGNGGGIWINGDDGFNVTATLSDYTVVRGNRANDSGGGIYALNAHLELEDDTAVGGNGAETGAGIYFEGELNLAKLEMTGVTVSDNTATDQGGGLYAEKTTRFFVKDGCTFKGNTAAGEGGAICGVGLQTGESLASNHFNGNKASSGGAIYLHDCNITFLDLSGNDFKNSVLTGGKGQDIMLHHCQLGTITIQAIANANTSPASPAAVDEE